MKKILLIATGGTIASRPTEDGLAPQLCAKDILDCVPQLSSLCRIDALQLINIDSTNFASLELNIKNITVDDALKGVAIYNDVGNAKVTVTVG